MKFKSYMQDFVMAVGWFFIVIPIWQILALLINVFFEDVGLIISHLSYFEKGETLAIFLFYATAAIPFCLTYFVQFLFCLEYNDRKFRALIENVGIWHYIILAITILFTISNFGETDIIWFFIPFWIFIIICGIIYHIFKPKLIRSRETVRKNKTDSDLQH